MLPLAGFGSPWGLAWGVSVVKRLTGLSATGLSVSGDRCGGVGVLGETEGLGGCQTAAAGVLSLQYRRLGGCGPSLSVSEISCRKGASSLQKS